MKINKDKLDRIAKMFFAFCVGGAVCGCIVTPTMIAAAEERITEAIKENTQAVNTNTYAVIRREEIRKEHADNNKDA